MNHIASLLTHLGLALVSAAPALTQDLARVENLGDRLVFHPLVELAQMSLTVTGPCDFRHHQAVAEGDLEFALDATTIDGVYRADLVRIEAIDPDVVAMLRTARDDGDESVPKALCRDGRLPGPPISQSFGFLVAEGRIVWDPEAVETSGRAGDVDSPAAGPVVTKDWVKADDAVIQGSLCVGLDCADGEKFNYDTIRLKENNLRIKFDDTSTQSSFPRNDWNLTVNSRFDGGLASFSIDDLTNGRRPFSVEAKARNNSLYVDGDGRIGSRTSTPAVEIHTIDGNTPTLRLEQDASAGFEPQIWDVSGNEVDFAVRDVTGGGKAPFRILHGAPFHALVIDSDGDIGVGTPSPAPDTTVHVVANTGAPNDVLRIQNNGPTRLALDNTAAGDIWRLDYADDGTLSLGDSDAGVELRIDGSGNVAISGGLVTLGGGGACTVGDPCDDVFDPSYPLPSIEEHAAAMWANSYLPAVGATPPNQPVDVTRKTLGVLNELEKAHIYIEQLSRRLEQQDAEMRAVLERLDQLEEKGPAGCASFLSGY